MVLHAFFDAKKHMFKKHIYIKEFESKKISGKII